MNLPRMSLHIGDYKRDTGHLRAAEHGAYMLLIMHYWSTGGLPADDKRLAAIACMTDREWKAARSTLAAFFKDGWTHGRIDRELKETTEKYERIIANGKKGGRPKKNQTVIPEKPDGSVLVSPTEPDGKATLTLTLKKEKKEEVCEREPATAAETAGLSIRAQSHQIADECYQVLGIEPNGIPPDWYGLPYQIEMMLARGYDSLGIVVMFARYAGVKPLKPMQYFVKAVESSQSNPLKPAEKMNGSAAIRSDKSAIAALDRLGDAFAAYGLREETRQAPVVQLPARRLR